MLEDEEQAKLIADALSALTAEESKHLQTIVEELSRPEARDPKVSAVRYFLTEHRTEGKTWLEHGCIVFSQYYDTVVLACRSTRRVASWRARWRLCRRGQERNLPGRRLRIGRPRRDQDGGQGAADSPGRRDRRCL